ncbi:MAG: DUF1838 family protein [Pyrinomonadaceae bacterium]|nr:DUF1838 family protein [Pyrinomonadaceae bacterium]
MSAKILLFLIFFLFSQTVLSQSFNAKLFKEFTDMRVGTGEPIYWYCIGEIYEYPSGKLVAKVEGIDTARRIKSESNATKVLQLSRKIFFYRDAKTNDLIRESNGMKVEPIAYPYQQITYELKGEKLFATVIQGKAPRVQKIESAGDYYVRNFGDNIIFSTPLFLNFPNYKAYENYDFFYSPKAKNNQSKYQLTWNRRGNLPPFFGGGDSVFQLVSNRVDKYSDLPKTMRDALESDGKLWMNPPKDLAEIAELQK